MGYDGDAALVLFSRNDGAQHGLQLFSKLHNIYLVSNQRVWPLFVAVEKYLFDEFFT